MKKILVLAEKPSVGRDIARVLNCNKDKNGYIEGSKYKVTWALGHLVTLADPESYGEKYKSWKMEDLPILPPKLKTVVIKKTSKQFNTVKSQLNREDVGEIVIATDAGREGELVARWIIEKAHIKNSAIDECEIFNKSKIYYCRLKNGVWIDNSKLRNQTIEGNQKVKGEVLYEK